MDVLGKFSEERCVLTPNAEATSEALWKAWREWAEKAEEKVGTHTAFGRRLTERGFESIKMGPRKDKKGRRGIGLKASEEGPKDYSTYRETSSKGEEL